MMYFKISLIIKVYIKKLKVFNKIQLLPSQMSLKVNIRKNFIMNQAQNPSNLDDGLENCLFQKMKKTGLTKYLFNITLQSNHQYNNPSNEDVIIFYCRTDNEIMLYYENYV